MIEIALCRCLMKIPDCNMSLTKPKRKKKLARHFFSQLWEKCKGKGLFFPKYVWKPTLLYGLSAHSEADPFMLIQHTLVLRTTSENCALQKMPALLDTAQNGNYRTRARTKGEVKEGNALFGEWAVRLNKWDKAWAFPPYGNLCSWDK